MHLHLTKHEIMAAEIYSFHSRAKCFDSFSREWFLLTSAFCTCALSLPGLKWSRTLVVCNVWILKAKSVEIGSFFIATLSQRPKRSLTHRGLKSPVFGKCCCVHMLPLSDLLTVLCSFPCTSLSETVWWVTSEFDLETTDVLWRSIIFNWFNAKWNVYILS